MQVDGGVERRQPLLCLPPPDCLAWVVTMQDTRVKLPTTKRRASMTCPLAMVRGFAPRLASRCQVRLEGRSSAPSRMQSAWQDSTSPT